MAEREATIRVESLAADELATIEAGARSVATGSLAGEGPLASRVAWLMLAKALAFVFSFALPILLVRRMDTNGFGVYKQFTLFVGTAITLLPAGVGVSALYFLARDSQLRQQIVWNILIFHLAIAGAVCLILVVRPQLLGTLFASSEMTSHAPLIGLVVLLWVGSAFLEFVVVANQEVKLATVFVVVTQFSKAACLISAALFFGTVRSIIGAAIAHGALQMLLLLSYLRSRFGAFWRTFKWPVMHSQLAYALPLGFASMIFQTQLILDNYFVSYRFGSSLYAIYAVGCFQLPLIDLLSESVGAVTIPRVSYLQKHGRRSEIIDLLTRVVRKLALIYFPLYSFLLVSGREFLLVLFTGKFAASWPIFAVNITLIPLALVASAYDPVMRAYAEHRYFLLRLRIIMLAVLSIALWYATGRYGLIGAITTMVLVNGIERMVTALKVKSILGLTRRDAGKFKDVMRIAAAAAFAGIITTLARHFLIDFRPFVNLVACAVTFALVYLGTILVLGLLTPEERQMAWQRLTRLPRTLSRIWSTTPSA